MNVRRALHASLALLYPAVLACAALLPAGSIAQQPQPVPVHHVQGTTHAFLVLRAENSTILGYGELLQIVHGDRVNSHLTYHFRDGSLDDDTAVFSQGTAYHLISDHHIQPGSFSKIPTSLSSKAAMSAFVLPIRTVRKKSKQTTLTFRRTFRTASPAPCSSAPRRSPPLSSSAWLPLPARDV